MHRFYFPVIEYLSMKELGTLVKVGDREMDTGTVGHFTCFVIGSFYLFDGLDDRADM